MDQPESPLAPLTLNSFLLNTVGGTSTTFTTTVTLTDGQSIGDPVVGDGGAQFFGLIANDLASFEITAPAGAGGLAVGNFIEASPAPGPVPGAGILSYTALGLMGLGSLALRRRQWRQPGALRVEPAVPQHLLLSHAIRDA